MNMKVQGSALIMILKPLIVMILMVFTNDMQYCRIECQWVYYLITESDVYRMLEEIDSTGTKFDPFPSKVFALIYALLLSPRPMV